VFEGRLRGAGRQQGLGQAQGVDQGAAGYADLHASLRAPPRLGRAAGAARMVVQASIRPPAEHRKGRQTRAVGRGRVGP